MNANKHFALASGLLLAAAVGATVLRRRDRARLRGPADDADSWASMLEPYPAYGPRRRSVAEMLDERDARAAQGPWVPASGGTETPFRTRTGRRLQYCWQRSTGKHAYLDCDTDLILSDEEAQAALGMRGPSRRRRLSGPARRRRRALGAAGGSVAGTYRLAAGDDVIFVMQPRQRVFAVGLLGRNVGLP